MIIKGEHLTLKPLTDIDYLLKLSKEYAKEEFYGKIDNYENNFWEIYFNRIRHGVIGYFKIEKLYILEAFKDRDIPSVGLKYSIEAGNLLLDYMSGFTDKVITGARVKDRAIQVLCIKLGFREIQRVNEYNDNLIIYQKDMLCH